MVFILLLFVINVASPAKQIRSRNRSISLKNVNPNVIVLNITSAPYQNLTDQIEVNPDSEQIAHNGRNLDSDRVLERLTLSTPRSTLGASFDEALLDFSAYLTKPFVFDYSKALSEAVEQAKSEVLSTNYNLDASKFEGSDLQPFESHDLNTDESPRASNETIHFDGSQSAPRAEKLVRNPSSDESTIYRNFDETKLPLGFAFFEALREQNNRPYFEAFARTTTQLPFIPSPTELPTTDALNSDGPSTFYRRRNAKKTSEFENENYNTEEDQENPNFSGFTHDNSAETSDHDSYKFDDDFNPYYKESEETTEEPKYTITNTNTNTYGAKPGMKFNRYSRVKLIQENKPITKDKPTGFEKKNYSPKRRNSQTSSTNNLPVKITLPKQSKRKSGSVAPYLYNDEVYHPNESNEFRIVVTPSPAGKSSVDDLEGAASDHQPWRQVAPRFGQLNRPRPQDVEHVRPVTTKRPVSEKSPPARKPSQQKPPEEMRYFQ